MTEPKDTSAEQEVGDDNEPDEFNVEIIRDKRINPRNGVAEYLVKWEGYSEAENTWEPMEHLLCPDLIKQFEDSLKNKRKRRSNADNRDTKRSKKTSQQDVEEEDPLELAEDASDPEAVAVVMEEPRALRGFERGLELKKIHGACENHDDGKLMFFVEWKGTNETELLSYKEIEEHAPKIMCAWYRQRLYDAMKTIKSGNSTLT